MSEGIEGEEGKKVCSPIDVKRSSTRGKGGKRGAEKRRRGTGELSGGIEGEGESKQAPQLM